jgi:hypothetical protein
MSLTRPSASAAIRPPFPSAPFSTRKTHVQGDSSSRLHLAPVDAAVIFPDGAHINGPTPKPEQKRQSLSNPMSRDPPDRGNVRTSIRSPGRGNATPKPDFGNCPGARGGGTPTRANIKDGLDASRIIETITPPARLSAPEHIPIENTRYVASYNWVEGDEPTIVVPGTSVPPEIARSDGRTPSDCMQVRRACGQGASSRSSCKTRATTFSTRTGRVCPHTLSFRSSLRRTGSTTRRRLSTGQLWTSSRTATACASSCAGSTRPEARRRATFGSMWNSWARRLSF